MTAMSLQPKANTYLSPTTKYYGFTALPADQSKTPPTNKSLPRPVDVASITIPDTPLAKRVLAYVEDKLNRKTLNHCLRVYVYGVAVAREGWPEWGIDGEAGEGEDGGKLKETWFLTAMLHDIGTAEGILDSTRLSFEFWGGMHALEILVCGKGDGDGDEGATAPREQAESVCEAIIRHQDVQDKGNLTLMTRLIHLGTLLDNVGAGAELVHEETIQSVNAKYDRTGWSACFETVLKREKEVKPYAMVSRIEGFEEMIGRNDMTATEEW